MKILNVVIICSSLLFAITQNTFSDSWNKFRGDPKNTGWCFVNGPETPEVKWVYEWTYYLHPGNPFDLNSSPVIGPDGTIYYAAEVLYAFDKGGNVKWTFDPEPGKDTDTIPTTPLISAKNEIFFGTWNGYFYKLKVVDDQPQFMWNYYTGNRGIESSPTLSRDGTFIYFGSNNKYLFALRSSNGELLWKADLRDMIVSSPCIDENDNIYIGSWNGYIYSISRFGDILWYVDTGDTISSSSSLNNLLLMIDDDSGFVDDISKSLERQYLYTGSWSNYLYGIDTASEEIAFTAYFTNTIRSCSGIGLNGMVYTPSFNYYIEGHAPLGYRHFRFDTYNVIYSSPAIDFEDNIYFGGKDGFFYSIDGKGNLRWTFDSVDLNPGYNVYADFYSGIVSSPAVDDEGTIYFASYEAVAQNQFRMKFFALGPGSLPEEPRVALSIDAGIDELRTFVAFANPGKERKLDLIIAYENPQGQLSFFPGYSKQPVPITITMPSRYRSPNIEFFKHSTENSVDGDEFRFYAAFTEPGTYDLVGSIVTESFIFQVAE